MMRLALMIVAAEAFSVQKPEVAMIQAAAGARLKTGSTVLDMLTDMRTETQQALKEKQDELATKRSTCDENTSTYKATITAETSQRAQAQAETTAYSAKNGAYDAKCAQLKTRSDDSATAYDEAMAETNAEKTKEMQDQEIECNTLQSALTVLTNKQTGLVQTGAGTGVMTQAMTQKLYDVVARETNVVDADTVIAAIQAHKAQTTYSTAVGQTGGFGTIVGIVMGLHNHCLETKDRLETELAQLNDHLDEQRSLTKQIMESDATALNTCQTELAAVLAQLQIAQSNLADAQDDLANAVKSLSDEQRACNDAIEQMTAFIRKHKEVEATLTEVLAILDHAFAAKVACSAQGSEGECTPDDDMDGDVDASHAHCEWVDGACKTSTSFIQLQMSDPAGPAAAHTDHGFSRVCNLVDKMREETERKKATFERERNECNKIMPQMVNEINRLDSLMDDAHYRLDGLSTDIRGTLHQGHDSLDYRIDEKLPQEIITLKVELQRESNERRSDSEANAAEIATQNRYIAECKDAIQKLTKISAFQPNNGENFDDDSAPAAGVISNIISMINNLVSDAENSIELATNTEKTNHADYMDAVADTNSAISLKINKVAELKGQRGRKLEDEIAIKAQVEALYNNHHNLGIDFMATCKVYGSTAFEAEDRKSTDGDQDADGNGGDVSTDGEASWAEFQAGNEDSDGLYNTQRIDRFAQLIAELDSLAGRLACE